MTATASCTPVSAPHPPPAWFSQLQEEEAGLNASLAGLSVGESLDQTASTASTASGGNLAARQSAGRVVDRGELAARVNVTRARLDAVEARMVSANRVLRQDLADISDMLGGEGSFQDQQDYT